MRISLKILSLALLVLFCQQNANASVPADFVILYEIDSTESKNQLIQNVDGEIYPASKFRNRTLVLYGQEGEEITITRNSTIIFGARRGLFGKNRLCVQGFDYFSVFSYEGIGTLEQAVGEVTRLCIQTRAFNRIKAEDQDGRDIWWMTGNGRVNIQQP